MRTILQSIFYFSVFATLAMAAPTRSDAPMELRIMVDPDIFVPLQIIARDYAITKHRSVTLLSTATKDPASLIEEGLQAELIVSADTALQTTLESRGQMDVFATRPLVAAGLALVQRKKIKPTAKLSESLSLATLLTGQEHQHQLVIYDPATSPLGVKSLALLRAQSLAPQSLRFVPDATAMQAALKEPNTIGILLAPVAMDNTDLTILTLLPTSPDNETVFTALVIAGETMPEARSFLEYLHREKARDVFAHYGFTPRL
ncbi:MAG: molybdate ABC transporter substrate-binding protein [Alphaproteobacteria bacterium]